ncbi:Twinkle -like protein, chloroplastic/mitochondrial [Capsicum annuum]|nr:Twinkle -like protein, chloroplastic/mitochondrial [Capsicum annuum]KAF3635045.1 Twinkle -like protein, chloroplastic/mitochondrial [Capsicum annuum]
MQSEPSSKPLSSHSSLTLPNRHQFFHSSWYNPGSAKPLKHIFIILRALDLFRRYLIVIAFTYRRDGALVSCKYRDMAKKFWQEADTLKIFYGLDDIKGSSDIIIVEGEMDKLAMEEAGFRNCVSVPDGAPPFISDKELPPVDKASRIILATDGDPPGQALAEELARRLGRERCWRVTWPNKTSIDRCKDANEVLMYLGPGALREVIEGAELYPIQGLFNFKDYFTEIDAYYHQTIGYELGVSTGWRSLNQLYNVVPGELTIVTGVPNSGKSEWIDALLCNLNHSVGWKFALCSMENRAGAIFTTVLVSLLSPSDPAGKSAVCCLCAIFPSQIDKKCLDLCCYLTVKNKGLLVSVASIHKGHLDAV